MNMKYFFLFAFFFFPLFLVGCTPSMDDSMMDHEGMMMDDMDDMDDMGGMMKGMNGQRGMMGDFSGEETSDA